MRGVYSDNPTGQGVRFPGSSSGSLARADCRGQPGWHSQPVFAGL